MKREGIFQKIKSVFKENEIDTENLKLSHQLGSGLLRIDSVKFMKLMVDLENEFDIELDYRDTFGQDNTLEELIDYIEEKYAS
ncbi:acyl carrier protein [Bacillus cereus]|nr:acyl carrier protein [Bacillus cereus]